MRERNLGFVVCVAVGRAHLSVAVVAEGGVVAVGAFGAHHALGVGLVVDDAETILVAAFVVGLRSAEGGERQLVVCVDALAHVHKIVVGVEVGALDVTVAPFARALHGYRPAAFEEAGAHFGAHAVHAVVTESVPHVAAALGIEALGGYVDGAADRRSRENGCAEAALCLDAGCHIAQAGPVAPVHPSAFHVVHGDAVHEHGHVCALETAHVYFCVAEAAAVLGGPNAGGGVENFGKFLGAQLEVDFGAVYLRDSHWCLACARKTLGNHHVVENLAGRLESDGAHVGTGVYCFAFVANVGDGEAAGVGRHPNIEVAVDVGCAQRAAAGDDDAGADYGFALLVHYGAAAIHCRALGPGYGLSEAKHQKHR